MNNKPKQVKAFRVQGGSDDRLAAEDLFDRLHNAEHRVKRKNRAPLHLQHVFSRAGSSNTFLINLTKKATPNFVEAVVHDALGTGYSTSFVNARIKTDKFLPGEQRRPKEETKLSVIEREAAAMAGGVDCSAGFILVTEAEKVVYSYKDKDQGRLEREIPERRGAHADVDTPSDTPQAILEQGRPDHLRWSAAHSKTAGTPSRIGGAPAAGTDDLIQDQPPSNDYGAVPGAAGGKRRGSSPHENHASGEKRARTCQERDSIATDTGESWAPGEDWPPQSVGVVSTPTTRPLGFYFLAELPDTSAAASFSAGPPQPSVGGELPSWCRQGAGLNSISNWKEMLSASAGDNAAYVKVVQEVVDAGAVPNLVEFLQHDDDPVLQFDSAWVLTKIASGTSDQTKAVIENGAVPNFVRLINSLDDAICLEAVEALRSRTGRWRSLTWRHPTLQHELPALSTLAKLIRSDDEEVLSHACRSLRFLCTRFLLFQEGGDEFDADRGDIWVSNKPDVLRQVALAVVDAGICLSLVELMEHTCPAVQVQAMCVLCSIAKCNRTIKAIIDSGALPRLRNLLSSSKSDIRKFACITIRTLIGWDKEIRQAMFEANILPPYIRAIPGSGDDMRAETALQDVILVGTPEQVKDLIPPLLDWLDEKGNVGFITVALRLLTHVLERGQREAQLQTGEKERTWRADSNQMASYMMDIGVGQRIQQLQMRGGRGYCVEEKVQELLQRFPVVLEAPEGPLSSWDVEAARSETHQELSGAEQLLCLAQREQLLCLAQNRSPTPDIL
eukprot:g3652.t1